MDIKRHQWADKRRGWLNTFGRSGRTFTVLHICFCLLLSSELLSPFKRKRISLENVYYLLVCWVLSCSVQFCRLSLISIGIAECFLCVAGNIATVEVNVQQFFNFDISWVARSWDGKADFVAFLYFVYSDSLCPITSKLWIKKDPKLIPSLKINFRQC